MGHSGAGRGANLPFVPRRSKRATAVGRRSADPAVTTQFATRGSAIVWPAAVGQRSAGTVLPADFATRDSATVRPAAGAATRQEARTATRANSPAAFRRSPIGGATRGAHAHEAGAAAARTTRSRRSAASAGGRARSHRSHRVSRQPADSICHVARPNLFS